MPATALAGRYVAGRNAVGRRLARTLDTRLANLGEVERLSILPIVERHTDAVAGLRGEPRVSYLVKADDLTLLFDTGLGSGSPRTALESNVAALEVAVDDLDCVAISHLHAAALPSLAPPTADRC
jgi:7,8-dihydropterin-6-yl-methyl-4-(beta-D-ribofuranosyl)aminobenzene 5'-phosphate synthase